MPVMITLQKIRDNDPCTSGWEKLLNSKGGDTADYAAEFPLSDVLDSNGLDDALWCLRVRPEYSNLWRKYAVWCARQVEHFMTDERSKAALDIAWRHSEGVATDEELAAARAAAWNAEWNAARAAARAAAGVAAANAAANAAWAAAEAAAVAGRVAAKSAAVAGRVAAWAAQAQKLREILTKGEW